MTFVSYKCPDGEADSAAVAAGDGLSVTGMLAPGEGIAPEGDIPGAAGDIPGAPGDIPGAAGDIPGAAGDIPGAVAGDIPVAGGCAGMPG